MEKDLVSKGGSSPLAKRLRINLLNENASGSASQSCSLGCHNGVSASTSQVTNHLFPTKLKYLTFLVIFLYMYMYKPILSGGRRETAMLKSKSSIILLLLK